MKKFLAFSLVAILVVPLFVLGCKSEEPPSPMPPLDGGQQAKTIEISTDEFSSQNHITKDVELTTPGSLIVTLGANPSTGFKWSKAEISDSSVIEQESHNFVESQTGMVGAPGKDVWVFNALKTGTAAINMSYNRPWEGGEKDIWTLTINVTVE